MHTRVSGGWLRLFRNQQEQGHGACLRPATVMLAFDDCTNGKLTAWAVQRLGIAENGIAISKLSKGNEANLYNYIYIYACIYIYTYIHIYMYTCIHVYMSTCLHVYMCTCVHLYICTYLHIYIYTYIHVYMYMYTCLHVYICTYVHIYIDT